MRRIHAVCLGVTLTATLAPVFLQQVQAAEPTAAAYVPADVSAHLTIRNPAELVRGFRTYLTDVEFTSSSTYKALRSNPGFVQAQVGLAGLAMTAGTDPWTITSDVLGSEIVIGLRPKENDGADFIAVAIVQEPDVVDGFLEAVYTVTGLMRAGEPDASRSREVNGVTVFQTDELIHCRVGDAFIASNNRALMRSAVEQRGKRLSEDMSYRQTERRVPDGALAWASVDASIVRMLAADAEGNTKKLENPLAGFLLGAWAHDLAHAERVMAWAALDGDGIVTTMEVESQAGLPETHAGLAGVRDATVRWQAEDLPGYLGEISVGRDWASLFEERESLLTLPAAGQIVNFSNTLTALMGRLDFMEDVLPRINGPTRFIAARQDFESMAYEPTPRLPAFALVAPLDVGEGERFTKLLNSASQTTLSIISLDMAQKDTGSLLLDMDRYRGYRVIQSEYADVGDGGEDKPVVSVQHNFAPSAAVVLDHYVVASSPTLLRSIMDQVLDSGDAVRRSARGDTLNVDVQQLLGLLVENRTELIADRMIKEDQTRAESTRDIGAILDVLGRVEATQATSDRLEQGSRDVLDPAEGQSVINDPLKPRASGAPWTRREASHLLRRAGFAPSEEEVQRALDEGLEDVVERLVDQRPDAPEHDELDELGERLAARNDIRSLRAWWLQRMCRTDQPLRARMAVLWHGHFATSNAKVRDASMMLAQLRSIETHGLGRFEDLLLAMARDPAMIVWLDGNANVKGRPNENFARELFELFSLGVGAYSERDIQEAARAFTGWRERDGRFVFSPRRHDDGVKQVLGTRAPLGGEDVVTLCLARPACSRFLGHKLAREFIQPDPSERLVESIAASLRECDFNLRTVLRRILTSKTMFEDASIGSRIKSPVEYVVGIVRSLDLHASGQDLADGVSEMGQRLYEPPSVAGWNGHREWLNATTMLVRLNAAARAVSSEGSVRFDAGAFRGRYDLDSREQVLGFCSQLLLGAQTPTSLIAQLDAIEGSLDDVTRRALRLLMSSPEYQMA